MARKYDIYIYIGAIGGPPCESWSVSRWRYFLEHTGPRPIRDGMDVDFAIWAMNPVRIRDLRQLDCANQLLLFMVLLIITQAANHRCCLLEHPACPPCRPNGTQPASIWLLPILAYLLRADNIHKVTVKQGYWGALSPKPTTLLVVAPETSEEQILSQLNEHRSTDVLPEPLCMGKAAQGGYKTAPLKRYTPSFCRGLSSTFQHAAKVIPFTYSSSDRYFQTFSDLKSLYLRSSDDGNADGADYVPTVFGKNKQFN